MFLPHNWLAALVILLASLAIFSGYYLCRPGAFAVERIAHAGGGYLGKTYTNSYEALDTNLQRNFIYFELDFVFTRDAKLVCLHDWKGNFRHIFGVEADPIPSLEEFEQLASQHKRFRNCTAVGLGEWMRENPEAIVVTDVKGDNVKALKQLVELIPQPKRRLIPQIYGPEELAEVAELGFEHIIWTIYRYRGSNQSIVEHLQAIDRQLVITMPVYRAKSGLAALLKPMGVPTYVHTINDVEAAQHLMGPLQVMEIYTDFLMPTSGSSDDG